MSENSVDFDQLIQLDIISEEMKDVIIDDIEKQKNERSRPFSDAYYYGMSRKYHKNDKFSKTFCVRQYLKKAIKVSTKTEKIDDKDLDKIFDETDLQKEFDESLKPLIIKQIDFNYGDMNLDKFVHLNQYLFE